MAYATADDLQAWLGLEAVPADAALQLDRASRLIDNALFGAIYSTDPVTLLPTDANIITALKEAVVAQIEWWTVTGDPLETYGDFHDINVLDAGIAVKRTPGRRPRLAPRAYDILHQASLLPATIVIAAGPRG